ncbi:peptidoglycan D,D-transpeptidase FtsI family protein [Cohnella faecalis]|uniref:Penicillin-binding protein 2 n=1 Tax=Cohnella faecalis TaxID=2315694 RepID=A0A398CLF2_9BACL|nr:penicillin-binding protein 2 [Cohnella faecalis]RIE03090.1 penicillin-binding protein 2 [Cohnella faecalis]
MSNRFAYRAFQMLLILVCLFAIAALRLAWVQLGSGRGRAEPSASIARQAVLEHSDELVIDTGRGRFLDRNGYLLTDRTVNGLVAFPTGGMPRGSEASINQLAAALGTTGESLSNWLDSLKEPAMWRAHKSPVAANLTDKQASAVASAGLNGVFALPYRNRYPDGSEPLHAIGYVSQHPERLSRLYASQLARNQIKETDGIGGSGLEKSLDRLIRGIGPTEAVRLTDAQRRPLSGLGVRLTTPDNAHFPLQVHTTLDHGMQEAVAALMEKAGVKQGAAVVLDVRQADILTMVSLPKLNPYRIGAEGTDERNHALTAFPPGSVFKTVTLAAALDSGTAKLDDLFRCDGEFDRYGLKCWLQGGHGVLTLAEAYAQSCNVAFAMLAEHLDPAWLQITADRLGLGRQIGWNSEAFKDGKPLRLLGEEESGKIFSSRKAAEDGGVRTGTGIGQRDVRLTPLQAANLVVTLLHGGKVASPRIVSEIRYGDGALFAALPPQSAPSSYGAIRPETAAAVLKQMRAVVTDGTAESALGNAKWPLAGKSGTAELAGKLKARNDHWFIGYGPAEGTPRYAVAVLIENQPAGLRNRASALFGDIMDSLRDRDEQAEARTERR